MINQAMQRKLDAGEVADVRRIGAPVDDQPGVFELRTFIEDIDYCDAENEQWIWSIGKDRDTGRIFASVDTRYYENPQFECLWLR